MIPQVLSHYQLPLLSCFGLLLFMGVFAGSVIWIFRRGSRHLYSELSAMPLAESEVTRVAGK